jgi:hypothetical protein
MEIHKPKAAHSWREFLIEIGTITCGILIALGLEQGIEALHWHEAVSAAREALHQEIARNNGYFADRVAVSPCIDQHIAQVSSLIESAAVAGRTPKAEGVALAVAHFLDTSEWEAQKAAQTLVHFPPKERSWLSAYYRQVDDIAAWRDEERAAWDGIAVLDGPPKRVSDADIAGLRVRLEQVRHLERLMKGAASREIDAGRLFGVAPRPADAAWKRAACGELHTFS